MSENELRRDLFTIIVLWDELLDLPRAPVAATTHHEAPLPIPVTVLSLRREAGEQLAAWAHLVYDERQLHTGLDLMNVIGVCRFLTTHSQWLACHAAGRDAHDEVAAIAAQITELVRQTRPQRMVLGGCPDCEGQIVAFVRKDDTLLPSEIRCNLNRKHVWTPWEWSRLGERLQRQWDEDATRRLVASILSP